MHHSRQEVHAAVCCLRIVPAAACCHSLLRTSLPAYKDRGTHRCAGGVLCLSALASWIALAEARAKPKLCPALRRLVWLCGLYTCHGHIWSLVCLCGVCGGCIVSAVRSARLGAFTFLLLHCVRLRLMCAGA